MRPRWVRLVGHHAREIMFYRRCFPRGLGSRILFLPPSGREMSSLLRGYNIADELRRLGWVSAVVPHQVSRRQRARMIRAFGPNIMVLLGSRHRDNDRRLAGDIPYVYDLDDADFHDTEMCARMVDDASGAVGVIAGSRYIRDWAIQYSGNTRVIWTGSPVPLERFRDHRSRGRLIVWAQTSPLQCPFELDFVMQVLRLVAKQIQRPASVRFYDCRGLSGESDVEKRVRDLGFGFEWLKFSGYSSYLDSLQDAAIGLAPIVADSPFSRGKSFGKILGYLTAGVPVLASDECDHQEFFTSASGVVSNDPHEWASEIFRLLEDSSMRNDMAAAAWGDFETRLSTRAAAMQVSDFCCRCISISRTRGGRA